MALTVTKQHAPEARGGRYESFYTIDFDASYPTGGEALTHQQLGFASAREFDVQIDPKSGYVFEYDYTNEKVLAYYGDNNNAADGPLVEVADTGNLSAVTGVRVRARNKTR